MNNKLVIAKKDIGDIKKNDNGVITSYLPKYNRFAVVMEKRGWFAFQDNEEWFLENFKIIE